MLYMLNHPRILCAGCIIAMWLMSRVGVWIRGHFKVPQHEDKDNLALIISATLTLLGLIIGFTFSMATVRYDQRRLFEENEANAIGTEYVRADLLPPADAAQVKGLLSQYLNTRITFYQDNYDSGVSQVDQAGAALQAKLWHTIQPAAAAAPDPVTALVVSGMNDVLNTQGYTQFSWWNRIPVSAWEFMIVIAILANGLIGYAAKRSRFGDLLLFILPLVVSVSFFLIADIDSPRGGTIRIPPRDLINLAQSIQQNPQQ